MIIILIGGMTARTQERGGANGHASSEQSRRVAKQSARTRANHLITGMGELAFNQRGVLDMAISQKGAEFLIRSRLGCLCIQPEGDKP